MSVKCNDKQGGIKFCTCILPLNHVGDHRDIYEETWRNLMSPEMEIGVTVQLKSGGPLMTVEYVNKTSNEVKCVWFNNNDTLHNGTFNVKCLSLTSDLLGDKRK